MPTRGLVLVLLLLVRCCLTCYLLARQLKMGLPQTVTLSNP